jgi:hypothetical protein
MVAIYSDWRDVFQLHGTAQLLCILLVLQRADLMASLSLFMHSFSTAQLNGPLLSAFRKWVSY